MSYTEADAELWDSDPYEYVRVKFDIFEDFVSPVSAAQTLLHSVCKKRKDVLPKTMGMLMGIVQDGANTTPSQKGTNQNGTTVESGGNSKSPPISRIKNINYSNISLRRSSPYDWNNGRYFTKEKDL